MLVKGATGSRFRQLSSNMQIFVVICLYEMETEQTKFPLNYGGFIVNQMGPVLGVDSSHTASDINVFSW